MCSQSLVNAWLVKEKTLPVQVAVGDGSMTSHVCTLVNAHMTCHKVQEKHHQGKLDVMPTTSASEVFVLIDGRISTTTTTSIALDCIGLHWNSYFTWGGL